MLLDLVTELLGADLMEHNILHGGIGVTEALDVLKEFHDIAKPEKNEEPQMKYFKKVWFGENCTVAPLQVDMPDMGDDLKKLAEMLGVEEVTQADLESFQYSLRSVEPRNVEGFGFGKISGHPNLKLD